MTFWHISDLTLVLGHALIIDDSLFGKKFYQRNSNIVSFVSTKAQSTNLLRKITFGQLQAIDNILL